MRKTWRILSLVGALWGLAGCSEPDCVGDDLPPSGASSSKPTMALVGEQVSLRVSPSLAFACSSEPKDLPSSISVEVYGPDNLPVESQTTLGRPATSSSTITFTPDTPGRYHVFAAFAPSGGIQQFDLYAASNRTTEAAVFTVPKMCNALERTERGGWVCDQDFIRDGAVKQHFDSARLGVAGNVVWVASSSQVERYVDTGTELALTARLPSNLGTTEFLMATETELLTLRSLTLERFVYDGTVTLSRLGAVQLPSVSGMVGTTGLRALWVRSGDRLGVITNVPNGGVVQPNRFTNQICAYRIEPARIVRTADPCQTFAGNVVGYEPGGVWAGSLLFAEQFDDIRWLEWTEAGIGTQASLPLGFNFKLSAQQIGSRNWVAPVVSAQFLGTGLRIRSTVAVYSPERRAILLELLDDELAVPNASGALVWTNPNTTALTARVRVRPETP